MSTILHTTNPARPAQRGQLDTTLSSTTPDLPRHAPQLPARATLAWGAGLGATFGALALRSPGAGFGLRALAAGATKGAAAGALLGGALLGLDRFTDGQVRRQLELVSLDRRAQLLFVLSNPTKPWLAGMGLGVARDARATQEQLYGRAEPLDGPQDAFRHAYAAALFSLRATRDHGAEPDQARRLALAAGAAHEIDGQDNNDAHSRAMDHANNEAGTRIAGDGRAAAGEPADMNGYVTEDALRARVLAAIEAGALQLVDRTGTVPSARPSNAGDLPPRHGR